MPGRLFPDAGRSPTSVRMSSYEVLVTGIDGVNVFHGKCYGEPHRGSDGSLTVLPFVEDHSQLVKRFIVFAHGQWRSCEVRVR